MSAGVHPDSPLFAAVNSLYEIGMRRCRGNPLETAVMDFAAKVHMHVLMFATINYLLCFLIPICVDFWFGTTWVEILVGPVTECLCCLIIALSFLVYYVKVDENENWKTTSVQVLTQVLKQFLVLLDHFCIVSFLQLKKLRQILQEVENCIERDETLRVIFISEEGLCHLLTLYDIQLQYQIDELLLANSKGFIQVMYYAWCMFKKPNATAESKIWSLESPGDVFRLINLLWTLWKICAANINFIKTSLKHEAASKVLTANYSIQLASRTVLFAGCTHSAMVNEYFRVIVSLGFTAFRYIGGALLMYMSGLWALPMWILVDIALSEILFGRACSTVCNSLPLDNPSPVQYSGFLKRFFTTGLSNYLLYNQGYLKHYRVPTTAILLLPGTVSFYLTIITFNGWRVISSPVETLESNVGAYYLSAFFVIIPIMIFVAERLFTRNNDASFTQQQMLLQEV